MGDDLTVTNIEKISRAVDEKVRMGRNGIVMMISTLLGQHSTHTFSTRRLAPASSSR